MFGKLVGAIAAFVIVLVGTNALSKDMESSKMRVNAAMAAPAVNGNPVIVTQQSITGQYASIASQTIFTPSSDGVYRINLVVDGAGTSCEAVLTYTDEFGIRTTGVNGLPIHESYVVRMKANQPLTLSTKYAGSGWTYDVDIVVEQLA